MLRTRIIRPGIVMNETLAKLGPEAELLFIRLWMLADREGRLADRPERIRAEAFPYCGKPVENLLKSLCETGFIRRYVNGVPVIEVINFKKHQWIHPREAESKLPPPPGTRRKKGTKEIYNSREGTSLSREGTSLSLEFPPSNLVTSNDTVSSSKDPYVLSGRTRARKTRDARLDEKTPEPEPEPSPRKRRSSPVDFWPYEPATVAFVRDSLAELARTLHRSPPDDAIVRKVLDASHGATGPQIQTALIELYRRHSFDTMRSWALAAVAIAPYFKQRAAGA